MIEEKMEYFQDMKKKALVEKKNDRDLIIISDQDKLCGAKRFDSDNYKIRNALVFVGEDGEQMMWKVMDGEIKECPTYLSFCVKGLNKMAVCVGNAELEESYHGGKMERKERNAKGEGSFVRNPNGTITHRKGVGYKSDGHRKTLTVTAATKSACIREMKKKEAEWNRRKDTGRVLLNDSVASLCQNHLDYQVENGDLRPKSIDRRECTIVNQIEKYDLGRMQIQAVTSVDIEQHIRFLMKEGKLSESSIIKTLDVLNAAYDWAKRRGDLEVNPVYGVKPELVKKIKKMSVKGANDADVNVLSEEEVERFCREASRINEYEKRYFAGYYCLLLLYTGMRVGEMIALRWRDVDLRKGLLTIEKSSSMAKNRDKKGDLDNNFVMVEGTTKNQKARIIQLTEEARTILARLKARNWMIDEDDLVAPTKNGRMNTASNLEHRMKMILKAAGICGINGGLHIFRKTFATRMYEKGARVEEIAAYIGDLESTTRKYYIAIRKKFVSDGEVRQIVRLPEVSRDSDSELLMAANTETEIELRQV